MTMDLKKYQSLFKNYTELRVQKTESKHLCFVKGENTVSEKTISSGVSARSYKNGFWGFASHSELDESSLKTVIRQANDNAAFLSSKTVQKSKSFPATVNHHSVNTFCTTKPRKSFNEIMAFVQEIDQYIFRKYSKLLTRGLTLSCLDMEKTLLTSDETLAYSMVPRTLLCVFLDIEKDQEPIELYEVFGGLGQFEDYFSDPKLLYPKIDQLYEDLMLKKEGVYAKAGIKECILDSEVSGILAHEAIGHTTEADFVLGGSIAKDYLDQQVASPLISLIDFAHTFQGQTCPIPVYIDDEGTKAQDTIIIDQGVLQGFMHNKETALQFNVQPTGHARAFKFSDEPLIRMRNTAILPGDNTLKEMISSIEDGYYFKKPGGGQADSTSEFMFAIEQGFEIKNGKLGRALKNTTISGLAFEVLKSVSMVSDDFQWSVSGMCGKKQLIPVSDGGPALKCRVNVGGRA